MLQTCPDFERATKYYNDISKYNIRKIDEKLGTYNSIFQTYETSLNYNDLDDIINNLNEKYDTHSTIYNINNPYKHYVKVYFYSKR